jgi:hypothetical protein
MVFASTSFALGVSSVWCSTLFVLRVFKVEPTPSERELLSTLRVDDDVAGPAPTWFVQVH